MSLATLDLLIGMAVVYVMLSIVVAAACETIGSRLKTRPAHLAVGLLQLLNEPEMMRKMYNHPLGAALFRPGPGMWKAITFPTENNTTLNQAQRQSRIKESIQLPPLGWQGQGDAACNNFTRSVCQSKENSELLSYIPSRVFLLALINIAINEANKEAQKNGSPRHN